jgi:hypothetical protein
MALSLAADRVREEEDDSEVSMDVNGGCLSPFWMATGLVTGVEKLDSEKKVLIAAMGLVADRLCEATWR